jgi:predicted nucleotidyltransferase
MELANRDIQAIRTYFRDKPVIRAFLFGSYARNEALENSDIDILVELDYTKHIGLGFAGMKLELEEMLQRKIDLVSSRAISKYISPFVDRDKRLIYEK